MIRRFLLVLGISYASVSLLANEAKGVAAGPFYSFRESKIYWASWDLRFAEGDSMLSKEPKTSSYFVLRSLNTTIRLLLEGDKIKYYQRKLHYDKWVDSLENCPKDARYFHGLALLKLHCALLKVSFGENLSGGLQMRQAYLQFKKNVANPVHLSEDELYEGAFLAALSNIPDNYQWAAQLIGLEGNEEAGFAKLQKVSKGKETIASFEAKLFTVVLKNYLQFPRSEIVSETKALSVYSSRVADLLCVWLYNKNNASKEALGLLQERHWPSFPYLDYVQGVTLFQLMDLETAEKYLIGYVSSTKSAYYRKDCFYKLSIMYELSGDSAKAFRYREKVKKLGSDVYYVDRQAVKKVYKNERLPSELLRAKIAFDGGEFETSIHCLFQLNNQASIALERNYLLARNFELLGGKLQATAYYKKVLAQCPKQGNYKGPMACLHLAEMAVVEKKKAAALTYLSQVEHYSEYEHKSTIRHKVGKLRKAVDKLP